MDFLSNMLSVMFKRISQTFVVALALGLISSGCTKSEESPPSSHVPGETVLTLTAENFQAEVLASLQPVLVDFWAAWCGPCKVIAPVVAELATEFKGSAKVGKVDVDAQTELAQKYNITAIPALMIFKGGKVVQQFVGVREKSELKSALSKFANGGEQPKPTNAP